MQIRIGTRKSALALTQAELVQSAITKAFPDVQAILVPISTSGDLAQEKPLHAIGGKGLFTKELEEALFSRQIDIAVHSMKDVPAPLPKGLVIAAMLEREDVRDAFISSRYNSLNELPERAKFGTSSPRRAAQILSMRPDLQIVPFRGNVPTRLQKIENGVADATLLALAGLKRLKLEESAKDIISEDILLPAASQGAIGIECREEDMNIREMLSALSHEATYRCVMSERALLETLGGNCQTPIAGLAQMAGNTIRLRGFLALPDGSHSFSAEESSQTSDGEALGRIVGEMLIGQSKKFHIL